MKNIMVCYDGSRTSKEALNIGAVHGRAFGARVFVVTSLFGGSEDSGTKIEESEKELEYAGEFLEKEGVNVETHLLVRGMAPGEDIVQFAVENRVEEIIIGARRRSKVGKLIFGSTAQYVILEALCPVVTVK